MSKLKRHRDERTKKKRIEHKKHRAENQSKRYGQIFLWSSYLFLCPSLSHSPLCTTEKVVGQETENCTQLWRGWRWVWYWRFRGRAWTENAWQHCSTLYACPVRKARWCWRGLWRKKMQMWFNNLPTHLSPWLPTEQEANLINTRPVVYNRWFLLYSQSLVLELHYFSKTTLKQTQQ